MAISLFPKRPDPGAQALQEAQAQAAILREELLAERTAAVENGLLMEERLAELELAIEDAGWLRLDAAAHEEFSREGLGRIVRMARLMYLKNPLINRGVEVQALYVWGQGVSVKADDKAVNDALQAFMDDRGNQAELTSHQAQRELEVELATAGNVFLVLFTDRVNKAVRVRSFPFEEAQDVIRNPEDRNEVWFYRRTWRNGETTEEAYYPDWRYSPASKPGQWEGKPVKWDAPVYHIKVGGFHHWRFGVPEVYAALDWARAYKEAVEDDLTRSKALARFVYRLTTPGGKRGVQAARTKLGTTLASDGAARETNPPPTAGSTFIGAEGVDLKAMNISQAVLPADHARPSRLLVASALGLPETFFGDADVGNHATSKTLDRPTELRFAERQKLWKAVLLDILQYVVAVGHGRQARQAEAVPIGVGRNGFVMAAPEAATPGHIDVDFPDILERSAEDRIGAIVKAGTLDGKPAADVLTRELVARLLLDALGVDDIDEEMKKLQAEWDEMDAEAEQPPPPPNPLAAEMVQARQDVAEALRGLTEALTSR